MKYSYEIMEKAVKSGRPQAYLFQEYGKSEATFYRWLRKYRSDHALHGNQHDRSHETQHAKKHKREIERLKSKANALIDSNQEAFRQHVWGLLLVHGDIDLDELLETTKAVYEVKYL